MQINQVSQTNFCAIPDKKTKNLLKNMMNNNINVLPTIALIKEIYPDKYLMMSEYAHGKYKLGLYNVEVYKNDNKISTLEKEVAKYSFNDTLANIEMKIRKGLSDIANSRTKKQKYSDMIDNFFAR